MIDESHRSILKGKKALVIGIANDSSIAYGCAKAFHELEAEVAITYLNEKSKRFVEPLAQAMEAPIFMPLDVSQPGELEAVFEEIPDLKLPDQMVGLAEDIIDRMSGEFEPDKFEYRYEQAMI